MYLINAQFGKILLVLAVIISGFAISTNPDPQIELMTESKAKRPVMVELDKTALAALSSETFYATEPVLANARYVFEPEKTVVVFQPVELDIPPAGIKRAPQLLPEPGPSLEGTDSLPRFGDEFQKVKAAETKPKPLPPGLPPPQIPGTAPATPPRAPKTGI